MKRREQDAITAVLVADALSHLPSVGVVRNVERALREGSWSYLMDLESHDFRLTGLDFTYDYFARNVMRKYPFIGRDRAAVALAAFHDAEAYCQMSNKFIQRIFYNGSSVARNRISYLREKISDVLGEFNWHTVAAHFAWGPGATTRLRNEQGDVYYKFVGKPQTTQRNLPLATAAIGCIPLWWGEISPLKIGDTCNVVVGGKVTTVPKNGKTDRTIAIEPCMNMYVQKGFGAVIRGRLKRVGVNLDDQSRNQTLAREALSRNLATIDLSAASDSVSIAVVDALLPAPWVEAMKQCRSAWYVLPCGSVKRFHKFSTMGNGFTFELESLIFWALCKLAVRESRVADRTIGVYGDDLVVPVGAVECLYELLRLFGFKPNKDKSFSDGHFRESCGKHYLDGSDVTPVYVKEPILEVSPRSPLPCRISWFANSILRWGQRCGVPASVLLPCWSSIYSRVPARFRLSIPDGVGDGGLVYPSSMCIYPLVSPEDSSRVAYQRGFDFMHRVQITKYHRDRQPTDVPYLLRSLYKMRDSVSRLPIDGVVTPPVGVGSFLESRIVRGWTSCWKENPY